MMESSLCAAQSELLMTPYAEVVTWKCSEKPLNCF